MKSLMSVLMLVSLITASTLVTEKQANAMSLENAEKVIVKGVEKNAEKVKNANVGVYNAVRSNNLSSYCRVHTGDCIGVALEIALFLP